MDLLPAEITARTGEEPGEHDQELTALDQEARLAKRSPHYAEGSRNEGHLGALVSEAQKQVNSALGSDR